MKTRDSKVVWVAALMSVAAAAMADEPKPAPPPQEPAGFVTGAVIGGFAAGPVGAVVGAGIGTWLGNRVHRASEAGKAEARVAELQAAQARLESDEAALQAEKSALLSEKSDLAETNRALTARLDELSHGVEAAQKVEQDLEEDAAAEILAGLQGDVLFRTGSADIAPEMMPGIQALAEAVAKSAALKVRVDGYADSRGTAETNLKLSEARADAVRDVFLAAGVDNAALEINAYGKSQSIAQDEDGYALERRVRLTLQAGAGTVGTSATGGTAAPGSAQTEPASEKQ